MPAVPNNLPTLPTTMSHNMTTNQTAHEPISTAFCQAVDLLSPMSERKLKALLKEDPSKGHRAIYALICGARQLDSDLTRTYLELSQA